MATTQDTKLTTQDAAQGATQVTTITTQGSTQDTTRNINETLTRIALCGIGYFAAQLGREPNGKLRKICTELGINGTFYQRDPTFLSKGRMIEELFKYARLPYG
jgi:hypothetical protein